MSDIAIEVDSLWKRFHRGEYHDSLRDFIPALARRLTGRGPKRDELAEGDFWALKDVSFQVRQGEVLGIIGSNGAGKSTLLKILAKILKPNRGHVRVNGRLRALIEVAAGFHPDLTGRENIYLNGTILGMKKREIDAKFDEIVEFSGIGDFLDTPVKRYSSGMHARLGFAVAAHLDPEILVVDEVLAVGDFAFQKRCLGKMRDVAGDGRTVLFVSHNTGAVTALCSRCILLDHGLITADGTTEATVESYVEERRSQAHTPLASRVERGGNGAVRIVDFSLFRCPEQPTSQFLTGDPMLLHLTLEARQERFVYLAVRLSHHLGDNVFYFTSREAGFRPLVSAAQTSCTLMIPWLPLLDGEYLLSAEVIDALSLQRCDVIEGLCQFRVQSRDIWMTGSPFRSRHGRVLVTHLWQDREGNQYRIGPSHD